MENIADTITVRKLASGDVAHFLQLILVFEEVFEMEGFVMPGEEHLQKLLDKPDFVVFAAIQGGKVIGGLTAYVLTSYFTPSADVYILDLAVNTDVQRRGIGRRLMEAIMAYCDEQDMNVLFVQADEVDKHAVAFYHSLGGIAERAVNFDFVLGQ